MRNNFDDFKKFINNKKVAVVGIGVSNIPLITSLINLGAKVTGFDSKDRYSLGSIIDNLEDKGASFYLGEGYLDNLTGFDVVFKTPSMRIDCDALIKAREEGSYITSEIEEFVRYTKGKIFAVTGSDGKTTTTSIIANLLKEEGYTTWVGGNIGTPLFSEIDNIKEDDKVVLELSSFQLMTMNLPVDVAVVTNITPNHLDMHKDMQEYIDAKKNIFLYQNEDGVLVLNKGNAVTNSFDKESKGIVRYFSSENLSDICAHLTEDKDLILDGNSIGNINKMKLRGIHNAENFLAAFLAVKDDVSLNTMKSVLANFKGVEHRCEFVRSLNGVSFYNDSIASSPTRTLAGLKSFDKKVILIAGGYDKKIPFDVLASEGRNYIKELILIGDTKYKIKESFELFEENLLDKTKINIVDTLEDAVNKAYNLSGEGDIVTLSPACASFDMFSNFMIRGERFKDLVNSL